jgi:SAM-dependent methyltransferase
MDAVEFLASVAGKRRALELGIGTGRIALPLAARGLRVSGIDASPKMVQKLREKPGGDTIPVVIGNFADIKVPGHFSLIYIVFNTFFGLLTQEDQVRCFDRVARHLTDDGVFVLEGFVPDLARFDRGQRTSTTHLDSERALIDAVKHDLINQRILGAHVLLSEGTNRFYPIQLRYAWPSELDLMARLAGMRLRERWGGWRRESFTSASPLHVSVFEKVHPEAEAPEASKRAAKPAAFPPRSTRRKRA